MQARRTEVQIYYEGVDISAELSGYLESMEYTDNASGKVDDLTLRLDNSDGVWSGDWMPGKTDRMRATIVQVEDGRAVARLYCGEFQVDEIECSGWPLVAALRAASVPVNTAVRREKKSCAWEAVQLSGIAAEVAELAGLALVYDVAADTQYDRVDQRDESDLAFLQRLCKDAQLTLKVTDRQIIVFDEAEYDAKAPVATITPADIDAFGFKTQAHDVYKACKITYFDPQDKQLKEYTYTAPGIRAGHTLVHRMRVGSIAEAERLAQKMLRDKNKHETTAAVSMRGNTGLVAGVNVALAGFGNFDGKYAVTAAKHVVENGYTTALELRRVFDD